MRRVIKTVQLKNKSAFLQKQKADHEKLKDEKYILRPSKDPFIKKMQVAYAKFDFSKPLVQYANVFKEIKEYLISDEYDVKDNEHSSIVTYVLNHIARYLEDDLARDPNNSTETINIFVEFHFDWYGRKKETSLGLKYIMQLFAVYPPYLMGQYQNKELQPIIQHWELLKKLWGVFEKSLDSLSPELEESIEARKSFLRQQYYKCMAIAVVAYGGYAYIERADKLNEKKHYANEAIKLRRQLSSYAQPDFIRENQEYIRNANKVFPLLFSEMAVSAFVNEEIVQGLFYYRNFFVIEGHLNEKDQEEQNQLEETTIKQINNLLIIHIESNLIKNKFDASESYDDLLKQYERIEQFYLLIEKSENLESTVDFLVSQILELINALLAENNTISDVGPNTFISLARKYYELLIVIKGKKENVCVETNTLNQLACSLYSLAIPINSNTKETVEAKRLPEQLVFLKAMGVDYEIIPIEKDILLCFKGEASALKELYDLAKKHLNEESIILNNNKLIIRGYNAKAMNAFKVEVKKIELKKISFNFLRALSPPSSPLTFPKSKSNLSSEERREKKWKLKIESWESQDKKTAIARNARLMKLTESSRKIAKAMAKLNFGVTSPSTTLVEEKENEELQDMGMVIELQEQLSESALPLQPSSTNEMLRQLTLSAQPLDRASQIYIAKAKFYLDSAVYFLKITPVNFSENDSHAVIFRNNLEWFLRRFFVIMQLLMLHKIYYLGEEVSWSWSNLRDKMIHGHHNLTGLIMLVELLSQEFKNDLEFFTISKQAQQKIQEIFNEHFSETINTPEIIKVFLQNELYWFPEITAPFQADKDELNTAIDIMEKGGVNTTNSLDQNQLALMTALIAMIDSFVNMGEKLARLRDYYQEQGDIKTINSIITDFMLKNFHNNSEVFELMTIFKNHFRNPACHEEGFLAIKGQPNYFLFHREDIVSAFELTSAIVENLKMQQLPQEDLSHEENKIPEDKQEIEYGRVKLA